MGHFDPVNGNGGDDRMNPEKGCVAVFVKAPEMGRVKTRLARWVGEARACRLYRSFTADVLDTVSGVGGDIRVFFHPPHARKCIVRWLGTEYDLSPQRGKDLGERMAQAFAALFREGYGRAVLIGTDFPDLPGAILREALDSLDRSDAVIGPAADGGYYLIGFQAGRFRPGVFRRMPWGGAGVYGRTCAAMDREKLTRHTLPSWRDIDEPADLVRFIEACPKAGDAAGHTVECLAELGLLRRSENGRPAGPDSMLDGDSPDALCWSTGDGRDQCGTFPTPDEKEPA